MISSLCQRFLPASTRFLVDRVFRSMLSEMELLPRNHKLRVREGVSFSYMVIDTTEAGANQDELLSFSDQQETRAGWLSWSVVGKRYDRYCP